jgi:hypothetical protein
LREGGPSRGIRQAGDGRSEQPTTRKSQDMLPRGTRALRPPWTREVHLTSYG